MLDYENWKQEKLKEYLNQLHYVAPKLGLNYIPSPLLKYSYPPANLSILQNITNALYRNESFYTQVLHLMNKMNLPAPFFEDSNDQLIKLNFRNANEESSEESELETDCEEKNPNFQTTNNPPIIKRRLKSLQVGILGEVKRKKNESIRSDKETSKTLKVDDVFDTSKKSSSSKISFKINSDSTKNLNMPSTSQEVPN